MCVCTFLRDIQSREFFKVSALASHTHTFPHVHSLTHTYSRISNTITHPAHTHTHTQSCGRRKKNIIKKKEEGENDKSKATLPQKFFFFLFYSAPQYFHSSLTHSLALSHSPPLPSQCVSSHQKLNSKQCHTVMKKTHFTLRRSPKK